MEHFADIAQPVIHYTMHLLVPGLIARFAFREHWKRAWLIMLATMLVDLDHLAAYPDVFVPGRCSIGFHPLHSYPAIAVYLVMAFIPQTRVVGVGLLWHMVTDAQDCLWM